MHTTTLLALVGLAFAAPAAHATQVIFEEDFESGLGGWIANDPWHIEADTDPCGSLIAPFPIGNNAAYYGSADCDFVDYGTASSLLMANSLHIPAGKIVTLTFTGYEDAECLDCFWDFRYLIVHSPQFFEQIVYSNGPLQVWEEHEVNLTQFSGYDIQIEFQYDPFDFVDNEFLGWMIDDVRIEIKDAPEVYCQTAPNTVGAGARIGWSGDTSVTGNSFWIRATEAPVHQVGLFYYGPTALSMPFGNGTRCVGGGGTGTVRLNPPGAFNLDGYMVRQVDFTTAPAVAGPGMIVAGSEWFFQCWYRDDVGAGHNLSDALRVPFSL